MSQSILQLTDVSKQFGDLPVLHDINLTIQAGERVALVGPSGAGKSTLLRLLNGSLLPDNGRISVFGQTLAQLNERQLRRVQQQIGTVYQQLHLVDNLQVVHNVNAGHLGRWPWWKAAVSLFYPLETKTAVSALSRVGIPDKLYERTEHLSGGQQQRVALARVLVQNPTLILADEPIASLDPERGREVMDLLRDMVQQEQKTLVVTLHTLEFAYSHCERIVGLRDGRILFDTPVAEVTPAMVATLYHIA